MNKKLFILGIFFVWEDNMQINIDKEIDAGRCPAIYICTVATTYYEPQVRENMCYKCWLAYCKEHNIEIIYD